MKTEILETSKTRATHLLSAGNPGSAVEICNSALRIDPQNAGLLNILGQAHLAQGCPSEASDAFRKAIQLQPHLPNLHYNLGLSLHQEGKNAESISSVRAALALDDKVATIHAKLGHLLLLEGDLELAIGSLQTALKLDQRLFAAHLNLAQAFADLGQLGEAERSLKTADTLSPNNPVCLLAMGRLRQQQGMFVQASQSFDLARQLQPRAAAPHFALAYSRKTQESDAPELEAMAELLLCTTDPRDRSLLHYALGKSFDDLGNYERAMEQFDLANKASFDIRLREGLNFDQALYSSNLDAIVEFCAAGRSAQPVRSNPPAPRPIFIVGMLRSGTTLVEQILARHHDIGTAGELPFWIGQVKRALRSKESANSFVQSTLATCDAMLSATALRCHSVIDKMPTNYQVLGAILNAYPNASIVHCRRNPADTCLSVYVTPFRTAPDFAHDKADIVFAYRKYQELMAHWKSAIPDAQILDVDYEDLISDQESVARTMVEYVGLPWDDQCIAEGTSANVSTPSNWQVRQPLYSSSIGRWRNYQPWLGPIAALIGG